MDTLPLLRFARALAALTVFGGCAGLARANDLSIAKVNEVLLKDTSSATDFTITSVLKERINPAKIQLVVTFYERTALGAIVPMDAGFSSYWLSLPVDWGDGPEVLQIRHPVMKERGSTYYGMVMGLYLRGKIQASYIQPSTLVDNLPDEVPAKR